ncbi:hypothetical protein SRHO_G00055970 [Serrasalmus rhombeus]
MTFESDTYMPKSKAPKMDDLDYIPADLSPEERSELEEIRRRKGALLLEIQRLREELREAIIEVEGLESSTEGSKTLQKSRHVAMGRKKFNMDPKKGIVFLVENELLRHTPEDIAQFLYKGEGLNKTAIGDYLGESIKNEPFKIPEDDGNDLTHTFFNPDREGWLLKLGGRVKTWKRRWFILTDNCLYYFEYTTDKEPRGIIPLENLSIREVEDPRKPNCFELYIPNNRGQLIKACKTEADGRVVEGNHMVYRISAPTPEEKDEWIHSIKSAVSVDPFYEMLAARKKRISLKKKEEQP